MRSSPRRTRCARHVLARLAAKLVDLLAGYRLLISHQRQDVDRRPGRAGPRVSGRNARDGTRGGAPAGSRGGRWQSNRERTRPGSGGSTRPPAAESRRPPRPASARPSPSRERLVVPIADKEHGFQDRSRADRARILLGIASVNLLAREANSRELTDPGASAADEVPSGGRDLLSAEPGARASAAGEVPPGRRDLLSAGRGRGPADARPASPAQTPRPVSPARRLAGSARTADRRREALARNRLSKSAWLPIQYQTIPSRRFQPTAR